MPDESIQGPAPDFDIMPYELLNFRIWLRDGGVAGSLTEHQERLGSGIGACLAAYGTGLMFTTVRSIWNGSKAFNGLCGLWFEISSALGWNMAGDLGIPKLVLRIRCPELLIREHPALPSSAAISLGKSPPLVALFHVPKMRLWTSAVLASS